MKVVINACYGGFGLSYKAMMRLAELEGVKRYAYYQTKYDFDDEESDGEDEFTRIDSEDEARKYKVDNHFLTYSDVDYGKTINDEDLIESKHRVWNDEYEDDRTNPLLIQVVEELGNAAGNRCSKLKIVEIPDDVKWTITDYDGWETIEEVHRSWN